MSGSGLTDEGAESSAELDSFDGVRPERPAQSSLLAEAQRKPCWLRTACTAEFPLGSSFMGEAEEAQGGWPGHEQDRGREIPRSLLGFLQGVDV